MSMAFSFGCVERTLLSAAFDFDVCWYKDLDSLSRVQLCLERVLTYGHSRLVAMSGCGERPRQGERSWVLKGTRMPVSAIFESLEAGANIAC
jgi:hypothetical protein